MFEWSTPGAASDDLIASGFLHFNFFWELREHFVNEELQLFALTAKAHANMHVCMMSTSLSPRRSWCYASEDFMGKMRVLASSASEGAQGVQVSKRMMAKYSSAIHLLHTDPRAWFWR